jgi:hypothetical protein
VEPGVSAQHTLCQGPGLQDGILDTQPTHFDILTRDAHGKAIPGAKGAGQPFEVKIDGPNGSVPGKAKRKECALFLVLMLSCCSAFDG